MHEVLGQIVQNIIENTEARLEGRGNWHPRLSIGPDISDLGRDAVVRHDLAVLREVWRVLNGQEEHPVESELPNWAIAEMMAKGL